MMQCSKNGCKGTAAWRLFLRLFPPMGVEQHSADADTNLSLCNAHALTPDAADLLSNVNQDVIAAGFASQGKIPPDFNRTRWVLVALDPVAERVRRPRLLRP